MTIRVSNPAPPMPGWNILGVDVAPLSLAQAVELLRRRIGDELYTKISFLNAHNANIASGDKNFALTLRDFLMLPDGVGVDIAAKILHGARFPDNLNGTDFIPALLRSPGRPMRVGLIGARDGVADRAAGSLAALAPTNDYKVFHHGFFQPAEEPAILERIAAYHPDILLVAMGVPRQENWIARNLSARHCTLPIGVGALLDFLSGAVPRAPKWVRTLRLEWVYRLCLEPARLWRRYVVGNPVFLARVMIQKLRGGGRS